MTDFSSSYSVIPATIKELVGNVGTDACFAETAQTMPRFIFDMFKLYLSLHFRFQFFFVCVLCLIFTANTAENAPCILSRKIRLKPPQTQRKTLLALGVVQYISFLCHKDNIPVTKNNHVWWFVDLKQRSGQPLQGVRPAPPPYDTPQENKD